MNASVIVFLIFVALLFIVMGHGFYELYKDHNYQKEFRRHMVPGQKMIRVIPKMNPWDQDRKIEYEVIDCKDNWVKYKRIDIDEIQMNPISTLHFLEFSIPGLDPQFNTRLYM